MESDLSLIEIAGEDDSLLQQIPNNELLSFNNNDCTSSPISKGYFSCSPLQIVRSKGSGIAVEKHSSLLITNSFNKENTNANKSEVPKLCIEPQQMKRKKKGGGYNLRKSLAWDRAFFTEEGVLNPLELSMISGNFTSSSSGLLPVIHEEGNQLPIGDPQCSNGSPDLRALEEKLFKETPASTHNGDRKIGSGLLPKHGSSIKDNVKRKVLAAQDTNRSGLKRGGCPRPVASSSVKMPLTMNATKAAIKEEKDSKVTVSKRDMPVPSRTVKNAAVSVSNPKHNQVAQRAVGVSRNAIMRGSSVGTKSALSNAKTGITSKPLSAKTSIYKARRNVASSLTKKDKPTHLQGKPVTNAQNELDLNPNSLPPSPLHPLSDHDGGSTQGALSLRLSTSYIGGNIQQTYHQTAKPSGLRMPSPSLGFFGQQKVSSSQSPLQSISRPYNLPQSNLPNWRIRPPRVPVILSELIDDETTVKNNTLLCSNSESSIRPVSHDTLNIFYGTIMREVKVKSSDHWLSSNDLTLHELENPCVMSHVVPALQVQDVSNVNLSVNNGVVSPEAYSVAVSHLGSQAMPRVDDRLNGTYNNSEKYREQAELIKPLSCSDHIPHDSQKSWTINGSLSDKSITFEDFGNNSCMQIASTGPNFQECSALNVEGSCVFSLDSVEQATTDTLGVHKERRVHAEDAQTSYMDSDLADKCIKNIKKALEVINLQLNVMDDQEKEIPNTLLVRGQTSPADKLQSDDCLLHRKSFSSEDSQHENVLRSVESEAARLCVSGCKTDPLCLTPELMLDCITESVEQLPTDDAPSGSLDSGLLIEDCNSCIDREAMDDIWKLGPNSEKLDIMLGHTAVGNVSPNTGNMSQGSLQNHLIPLQLSPRLQHEDKEIERFLCQHKSVSEGYNEDPVTNFAEKSSEGDELPQSLESGLSVVSTGNLDSPTPDDRHMMTSDDASQQSGHPEPENSCNADERVLQGNDHEVSLIGDLLLTRNSLVEEGTTCSSETEATDENLECFLNTISTHQNLLKAQVTRESDSSKACLHYQTIVHLSIYTL